MNSEICDAKQELHCHNRNMESDNAHRRSSKLYLDEWLKYADITGDALADAIGMTRGAVSKFRTGAQRYNQDALEKFADHFNCDAVDLLMPPAEALAIRKLRSKFTTETIDRITVAVELIVDTVGQKSNP